MILLDVPQVLKLRGHLGPGSVAPDEIRRCTHFNSIDSLFFASGSNRAPGIPGVWRF